MRGQREKEREVAALLHDLATGGMTYDARHRNMKTVVKSAFKVGDPEGRYVESDRFEEI